MNNLPSDLREQAAIAKTLQHYIDGARTGHRFTDLFTLLKVEGEWKIMNKVFHLHP